MPQSLQKDGEINSIAKRRNYRILRESMSKNQLQQLLVGATIVAGTVAAASSPSSAATLEIIGTDYLIYEAIDTSGDEIPDVTMLNQEADPEEVIKGTCTLADGPIEQCIEGTPGGNIELFASSENKKFRDNLEAFKNVEPTVIVKTFEDGTEIRLSSLNGEDWYTTEDGEFVEACKANNLAGKWFEAALASNDGKLKAIVESQGLSTDEACLLFIKEGGFQRISDPNIAYINKLAAGNIIIGLAGHDDAANVFTGELAQVFAGIQLSEVVKSELGGEVKYLYSFNGFDSGLVEKGDSFSHSAIYEVDPIAQAKVPEPTAVLGMLFAGGLIALRRKEKDS